MDVESEPGVVGSYMNGFTETDFIQYYRMSRANLSAALHKTLVARHSVHASYVKVALILI